MKIKIKATLVVDIKTNKYGQVWYEGRIDHVTRKPHGYGRRFYSNGDVFNGIWKQGRPYRGFMTFHNDHKYIYGSFQDGLLEGDCIEREDGIEVYKGKYQRGQRVASQHRDPTPEEYVLKLRRDLFDLWCFDMHRLETEPKSLSNSLTSSELISSKIRLPKPEKPPVYLYTYVSPMDMLVNYRVMNEYLEATEEFIVEKTRFDTFHECVFPLSNLVIRFNCQNNTKKEPVIYSFGADHIQIEQSWQYFLKLYKKEMPTTATYPSHYNTVAVDYEGNRDDDGLRKTAICYLLKLITFENFHQMTMPVPLRFTLAYLNEFRIYLFNAVLYNRNCLELTTENTEYLNKEKEKN